MAAKYLVGFAMIALLVSCGGEVIAPVDAGMADVVEAAPVDASCGFVCVPRVGWTNTCTAWVAPDCYVHRLRCGDAGALPDGCAP